MGDVNADKSVCVCVDGRGDRAAKWREDNGPERVTAEPV